MIKLLLDILSMDDFYGISEEIEVVSGKNKLCTNVKEAWEQNKRKKEWSQR